MRRFAGQLTQLRDRCLSSGAPIWRVGGNPLWVAIAAVILCLPAVSVGWIADDQMLRFTLAEHPETAEWHRSPFDLFSFVSGDAAQNRRWIAAGILPWWTFPELHIAFFRPLAGVSHWLDFRLWPERPWAAHVHSLLWLAVAAGTGAVLYRRILGVGAVAGLAAILFALDDAHGLPAMWVANRHSTMSVAFGLLALMAQDAWRRGGHRLGAGVAPLALAASLSSGEGGLSVGGYLLGYALFLDRGRWPSRLVSLLPSVAVGVAWAMLYSHLGYGVSGSAVYVDPASDPLRFAAAVVERGPLLAMGLWVLPSDLYVLLSPTVQRWMWLVACLILVAMAALLWPLLRHDRVARFFACGALLSIVVACATFASDRLLFFAGFGGMGLLAQLLVGVWRRDGWMSAGTGWRTCARFAAAILAVLNLALAPIGMMRVLSGLTAYQAVLERAADSFPHDDAVLGQRVMIVNTPSAVVSSFGPTIQFLQGNPVPKHGLVLGSSIAAIRLSRPDSRTLVVAPEGGFLRPGGFAEAAAGAAPASFDPRYMLALFDRLYRSDAMQAGDVIELGEVKVELSAVTSDGRPSTVAFHFARPLEDPAHRWLQWVDGVYQPFAVPATGEEVTLPAPAVPPLGGDVPRAEAAPRPTKP